jgi:hypothetical protein
MTDDKLKWIIKKRTVTDTSGCNMEGGDDGWWCKYNADVFGDTCTTCKQLETQECTGANYVDYEEITVSRLPGVPMSQVGCCINEVEEYSNGKLATFFTQRRPYDTEEYVCCSSGAIVKLCKHPKEWKGCSTTSEDYPGIKFQETPTDDGCCPVSGISTSSDVGKFLKKLSDAISNLKDCKGQTPKITATKTACHVLESNHYAGCAIDMRDVSTACLKSLGYTVSTDKGWDVNNCHKYKNGLLHCVVCGGRGYIIEGEE